jgi:dynein heavy chain, axonemal
MDMEFRIVEVQEQFRVLKMYNFEIEEDLQNSVDNLMGVWQDLRDHADKKDFDVIEYKNNFAIFTQKEVEEFKTKIKQEYEAYMAKGPGTNNVNLDEGMDLLEASKRKVREFNGIREENVLAEKLFNLPISKYPELIQMEETNKKYSVIYDVYKDYMT